VACQIKAALPSSVSKHGGHRHELGSSSRQVGSERNFQTWQGRLPQELRLRGGIIAMRILQIKILRTLSPAVPPNETGLTLNYT